MVLTFLRDKGKGKTMQDKLGAGKTHRLWRTLKHRYLMIDQTNLLKNFTHDQDSKHIMSQNIQAWTKEAGMLEKELDKYSVPSSKPSLSGVAAPGNTEVLRDDETARVIETLMDRDIEILMDSIRDVYLNDNISELFMTLSKNALYRLDDFIKYGKVKGWIEVPPLYSSSDAEITELIDAIAIHNLWHHLSFRYQTIHLTKQVNSVTKDPEFMIILKIGIEEMQAQAKLLENELLKFNVSLPDKSPEVVPTPGNTMTELIQDKFMFRLIMEGMQNALILQAVAIKEIITNDRLRNLFMNIVFDEISLIKKLAKYGKLKGWMLRGPKFKT